MRRSVVWVVVGVALAGGPARGQFTVTVRGPGVQTSGVSGVSTATFDGSNPLAPAGVGAYTGSATVSGPSVFGGAGNTNFLTVPDQSTTTLALSERRGYFGLYLSAADESNRFAFVRTDNGADTTVFTFSAASLYQPGVLTGTIGTSGGHFGSPEPGYPDGQDNNSQAYVYVNFYATEGLQFDRVVFTQVGTGGFESDNHSVRTGLATPGAGEVVVPVPEPAGVVLAAGLGLLIAGARASQRVRRIVAPAR